MRCIHYPPSPGQALCQCKHQQIEMEYAVRFAALSADRVRRHTIDDVLARLERYSPYTPLSSARAIIVGYRDVEAS